MSIFRKNSLFRTRRPYIFILFHIYQLFGILIIPFYQSTLYVMFSWILLFHLKYIYFISLKMDPIFL